MINFTQFKRTSGGVLFFLGFLLAFVGASFDVKGQIVTFNANGNNSTAATLTATQVATNVTASTLSRGSGLTVETLSNGFVSSSAHETPRTFDGSNTNNNFYEFNVTPTNGNTLNISSITGNGRASNANTHSFQFSYRIGTSGSFIAIGSSSTLSTATNGGSFSVSTSSIPELQGVSQQVFFRMNVWGSNASSVTGNTVGFRSISTTAHALVLNGTVNAGAPQGTFALTEGGNAVSTGATSSFGAGNLNTTATKDFTLSNSAAGTITGISATLTGTDAGQYTITTSPATSLAQNATTTVSVRYNRTAVATHNLCTLNITGTNVSNTPYTVILNGSTVDNTPTSTTAVGAASSVGQFAATFNATRTDANSPTVTAQGFVYIQGSNQTFTAATPGAVVESVTPVSGAFSKSITSLSANTQYSYRAYTVLSNGCACTTYSPTATVFTTLSAPPATNPVFGNITKTLISATVEVASIPAGVNGVVVYINNTNTFTDPNNGQVGTANLAYSGSGQQLVHAAVNPTGTFTTGSITGLSEGTTYYLAVYAYNGTGANIVYNMDEGLGQFTTNSSLLSLTAVNSAYTQNFNSMSDFNLPTAWRGQFDGNTPTWAMMSTAVTTQANSGSPTAGGTYRFGANGAFTDVAVGAMTSGGYASPNRFVLGTINNTGSAIARIEYSFDLEKYRQNSTAATITLAYSTNGSTFINLTNGVFDVNNTPLLATGSSSYSFTSPGVANISGTFDFPTAIANGGQLYFRISIATGGSSSQGIAIDNFSITPKAAAPTIAITANAAAVNLASPAVVNFGTKAINVTTDVPFVINNTGTSALTGVTATLSNTTDYQLVGTPSSSVNAGANTSFSVRALRPSVGTLTGNLTIASNDPTYASVIIPLSSIVVNTSSVLVAGAATSATIDYTITQNNASSPSVFNFSVADDQTDNGIDELPTKISAFTFNAGTGNTVSNFTSLLAGAKLVSGANEITGTVNATNITFTGVLNAADEFGFIADNATKNYTLKVWFRDNLTVAQKALVDNLQFAFALSNSNVTVASGSSNFETGTIESAANVNKIQVTATKLAFVAQPVNTDKNVTMALVTVAATDNNDFRDLDFTASISIAAAGMNNTPLAANAFSGLASFNSIVFPNAANNITIAASSAGITGATSNQFSILNATTPASYFRFVGPNGGNLSTVANWEASEDGTSGWLPATIVPTNAALEVKITGNKSAVLSSAFACSKLVIDAGCTLSTSGFVLTINNIATAGAVELEVNGLLETTAGSTGLSLANGVAVNINNGATLRFNNTGTNSNLISSLTGVTISFGSSSNLEVLGMSATTPPNIAALGNTVGNLKIESVSTSSMNFTGTLIPLNIQGNLEVIAPTDLNDEIRLSSGTAYTLNIGGNLTLTQGALNGSSNSSGAKTINVTGNVVVGENARLYFETGISNNLNIGGNYILNSGVSTRATSNQNYVLNFFGSTNTDLLIASDVSEIVRFSINKTGQGKVTTSSNIRVGTIVFLTGNIETRTQDTIIFSNSIVNETGTIGIIGNARITQTATQNQLRTFGNLGINITATGANPGQFIVTRTTGNSAVVTDPNNANNKSAKRKFRITGYNNAGSLNATVVFRYQNEELNDIPADNITMARSTNNGLTWLKIPSNQVTLNATNKTVTLTGINEFSDWTFQDGDNAPLPVLFAYVNGKRSKAGNELSFATAAEINNKGFEVQRSLDGKAFETIGFVAGAGNSNKLNSYQFTDATDANAYYRLNQIDFDGKATLSPVVYINGSTAKFSVAVAPNPVNEQSLLLINGAEGALFATLTDAKGTLIAKQAGNATDLALWFQANAASLRSGVYMLRIAGSEQAVSLKIVK